MNREERSKLNTEEKKLNIKLNILRRRQIALQDEIYRIERRLTNIFVKKME